MKTNLPIDLGLRTVTTKVSPRAWERAQKLKDDTGVRLSDIVSACLLYMPEEKLREILATQKKAVDGLPKAVKGLLRNLDTMTEAERAMLLDALNQPR